MSTQREYLKYLHDKCEKLQRKIELNKKISNISFISSIISVATGALSIGGLALTKDPNVVSLLSNISIGVIPALSATGFAAYISDYRARYLLDEQDVVEEEIEEESDYKFIFLSRYMEDVEEATKNAGLLSGAKKAIIATSLLAYVGLSTTLGMDLSMCKTTNPVYFSCPIAETEGKIFGPEAALHHQANHLRNYIDDDDKYITEVDNVTESSNNVEFDYTIYFEHGSSTITSNWTYDENGLVLEEESRLHK